MALRAVVCRGLKVRGEVNVFPVVLKSLSQRFLSFSKHNIAVIL